MTGNKHCWFTKNRLYTYNATNHAIYAMVNSCSSSISGYRHIFYILDLNYWVNHCCDGSDDQELQGIYKFLHLIRGFARRITNTKIHFILLRFPGISKSITKEFKLLVREACSNIGLPKQNFSVFTVENFYIKTDDNKVTRLTTIPNSNYSDYITGVPMFDKQVLIRIAGIVPESIVDGPGMRYVVFVQGCPHHCKGCHNPETWDFSKGTFTTIKSLVQDIVQNPMIKGVTFSGGEPFMQPKELLALLRTLKYECRTLGKTLDFISYTGFTLEQLQSPETLPYAEYGKTYLTYLEKWSLELLYSLNYLVDGPFMDYRKSFNCKFRGSTNQKMYKREYIDGKHIFTEIYPVEDND